MDVWAELRRWRQTLGYSLDGWRHAWREEQSLRQWGAVNLLSWAGLALIGPPLWATALVVFAGLMLLVAELINSALEATVDHISTDRHPLAKAAKDCGSAAVTVTALAFALAWVFALIAG